MKGKKSNILFFSRKNSKTYLLLGLRFFASANGFESSCASVVFSSVALLIVSLPIVSLVRVAFWMVSFVSDALIESFAAGVSSSSRPKA